MVGDAIDEYEYCAFFVSLAALSDSSLVLSTVAHELGVMEQGGQPILETLKGV